MLAFLTLTHLRSGLARRARRATLLDLIALRRQRRQLAGLDPHLLRDIGLTRGQAEDEALRALWDVPRHWRA